MKSPIEVGSPETPALVGLARSHENSFPATLELGGRFATAQSESAVALDTGATANLVCYKWPETRNSFSGKRGFAKAAPYPSSARFKFGDGRVGVVGHAADIKVGIAGRRGAFTAFALDAEIPTLIS